MTPVSSYRFRATLSKVALMHFLATAPAGHYAFVAPAGTEVYGILLGDEVSEFLCNECVPADFTIITREQLQAARRLPGARTWGDPSLLDE
jgi:hypothetical protein